MSQLLIRNIEEELKTRLKQQAARHGRSMEDEARDLLRDGLRKEQPEGGLGTEIAELFRGIGLREGEEIPELRGGELKDPFEK